MSAKTFNGDQKIKLTQIINEGMQVMHEIDTLQAIHPPKPLLAVMVLLLTTAQHPMLLL